MDQLLMVEIRTQVVMIEGKVLENMLANKDNWHGMPLWNWISSYHHRRNPDLGEMTAGQCYVRSQFWGFILKTKLMKIMKLPDAKLFLLISKENKELIKMSKSLGFVESKKGY